MVARQVGCTGIASRRPVLWAAVRGGTNMNLHRVSLVDSPASNPPPSGVGHPPGQPGGPVLKTPSLLPGSDREQALQAQKTSADRAKHLYDRAVLSFRC